MEQTQKQPKKIILKEYHSYKYLEKMANNEEVIYVLPNKKEILINKKEVKQNDK